MSEKKNTINMADEQEGCKSTDKLLQVTPIEFDLTLIRHGETEFNKEGLMQGQVDIPLSSEGLQQAKALGSAMIGTSWTECWSSDLQRAWQTANFLLDGNPENLSPEKEMALASEPLSSGLQMDPRLRERRYGVAEGKSLAHLKLLANNAGVRVHRFVPPGGETLEEVKERGISFFQDLYTRQAGISQKSRSSVVLVSHGGWLKEFMSHLCSHAGVSASDKRKAGMKCPNTGVSKFTIQLGAEGEILGVKCLSIHDNSHLLAINSQS